MQLEILTRTEAARVLRISPKKLSALAAEGAIRYRSYGRKLMFARGDLQDFLDQHAVGGPAK